jgi:thioredoxin reductase (NADPH)
MSKPFILALDDDPQVLQAVARDLRSEYGSAYRVLTAGSGAAALELLADRKRRGDPAALFVVDQRMPAMSGVEFLAEAVELYPDARRVLLTAYADTDAAIRAINDAHVDHYLLKPWDPPEERLYPVLTDLLDAWRGSFRPPFEGIRVVGYQWSPDSHRVKDFLARNNIPYRWVDVERSDEADPLLAALEADAPAFPCLVLSDGRTAENPDNRSIAELVGLQTIADRPFYDLAVVGAGPAGLAAAVYGASEGLKTISIEAEAPGGQAGMSSRIENYLGFPSGLSGSDLAHRAVTQAKRFGVEILSALSVRGIRSDGPRRALILSDGNEVECRAILIATGVSYRQLEAPGIAELTGAGIYYGAAMTEGESIRGHDVFVVGGANSAGQAAMYFSRFAANVTMLVRRSTLTETMSAYLIDQIAATQNIHVWTESQVVAVAGDGKLEQLTVSRDGGARTEVRPATALFIFIGATPRTDWVGGAVTRDEHGFLLTGQDTEWTTAAVEAGAPERVPYPLETSVPGIFAAGDVRHGSVKRVASAVGEGSMAVMFIHRYLAED